MRSIYAMLVLCSAILLGSNNYSFAQSTTFAATGSIVTYTVPAGVTSLNITASGAQGGSVVPLPPVAYVGGDGAIITGTVIVVPGHVLDILVGEQGGSASASCGGGGGGTFVWDASATTPLIVAGGGGGASSTENGFAASLTVDGTDGGGGTMYGGGGIMGFGGTPPTGITSVTAYGAGGCGWLSNGAIGSPGSPIIAGTTIAQGGKSPNPGISPGTGAGGAGGGTPTGGTGGIGGFGGGGGGQSSGAGITTASVGGGGGGGGYSGGGCGVGAPIKSGGGGGSYCSGTISSSSATNTGNGLVVITVPCGPGAITGNATLCIGSSEALVDTPSGGTWVSTNTSIATIDGSGNAWGVASGNDTILYIVMSSCLTVDTVSVPLAVAGSSAGTITGTPMVCVGTTTTLSDAALGGSWSASNTNASVSSGGIVTGNIAGLDTIYYTNSCSLASTSVVVTINPTPSAGTITGTTYTVCVGSSISLTDAATGGSWSSSSTAVATVALGTVYGASAGTSTIIYTVIGACATVTATHIITVNPLPVAGTITGTTVCVGATVTMTDLGSGTIGTGMWSSSNTLVATTSLATGSSTTVTGASPGTAIITYSFSNSCGTATATAIVTVSPVPVAGIISGSATLCTGASTTLTDGATGGTWSATNTDASVSGGTVTGVTAGVDTIDYTVSNSCGTAVATYTETINTAPSAGTISGPSTACIGAPAISLTETATGGTWSASNTNATVTGGGAVTGITAGTDNISYTVTNSCGSNYATFLVTISTAPTAGTITGIDSVCTGHTVTLADATTGGTWSSNNTKASVAGGAVTGATAGMDTIVYTVTNGCGSAAATFPVKVKTCPSEVNTITPADDLTIYPNPANEELTIKMSEGMFSSFTITNSVGQVMMEQPLNRDQTTVEIKALPSSAIYYIIFRGQNGTNVQRFIKM